MEWMSYLFDGLAHITDPGGYDHMIYLIALVAIYDYREFKKVLILATAFTLGHSITLALAGLNIIRPKGEIIEFLIPITILITALTNLRYTRRVKAPLAHHGWRYLFAVVFGLIHGMGFSSYFRMLLDRDESIVQPLLFFNLGVEVGQLLIVTAFMLITFAFNGLFRIAQRDWVLFFSGLTAGLAAVLAVEKFPF